MESAIKLSARYGGWSLSLTSSGEPTADPEALTNALKIYKKCADQGAYFPNVNLFSNGILLGDEAFCNKYLDVWRELGLNNIALSIHDVEEQKQAKAYNIERYPEFEKIIQNIEKHGLGVRGTLLLRKNGIDNPSKYESAVKILFKKGITNITSWPIGNPDGSRSEFTPSRWNLFNIQRWL